MRMGGRKLLNKYGRPQRGEDVQEHVEDWQMILNQFGSDFMMNPKECSYGALEIIPAEYEDEIVMNPDIRTMQGVYPFVTRKTTNQKHLAQQRALIQSRTRRSPISELSPKTNEMNIDEIVVRLLQRFRTHKVRILEETRINRVQSPRVLSQASFGSNPTVGGVVPMAIKSEILKSTRGCTRRMVAHDQRG